MRRALALALFACSHAPAVPPTPPGFGRSKESAIEVCLPPGEKAYVDTLRCAQGEQPRTKRMGSVGSRTTPANPNDPRILLQMDPERPLAPGEPDLHIVDAVEARCAGASYTLFFDMYHCPAAEQPAAEGFTRSATAR